MLPPMSKKTSDVNIVAKLIMTTFFLPKMSDRAPVGISNTATEIASIAKIIATFFIENRLRSKYSAKTGRKNKKPLSI
jgi:hypothetical protein